MGALVLIILMWLCVIAGHIMLNEATDVSIRWGKTVWASARPEFGAALLFYALAVLFASLAGGAL